MKNMEKFLMQLSLLLVLAYLHLKAGNSELIAFPRDTEVLVNQSTYFNCSTSIVSEQIHWYHYRVGENKTIYVFYKGQFNQIYADRYSSAINTVKGEYNLILRSVQPGDAGRYECQDDGGLGNFSSAELIVLDSTPVCSVPEGLVGPNSSVLPIDELQLSCIVSYVGNIPPILQWKMEGDDAPILKGIAIDYSGKRVTMNLTMRSEVEMDGALFTCSNTRSQDEHYSCTTGPVKINYLQLSDSSSTAKTVTIAVLVPTLTILLILLIALAIRYSKMRQAKAESDKLCEEEKTNIEIIQTNDAKTSEAQTPAEAQSLLPHEKKIADNEEKLETRTNVVDTRGKPIAGIAILDKLLYVVFDKVSVVETYDIETLCSKDYFELKQLSDPWDLASCKKNKCLYIMDLKIKEKAAKTIFRVDVGVKSTSKWTTNDDFGTLSVTPNGNVILTVLEKNSFNIYKPDGNRIRVRQLNVDLFHPLHTIQLSNGHFMISHGFRDDSRQRICIIDDKQQFDKTCFELKETPTFMVASEKGFVFVADSAIVKVFTLKYSDLKLHRTIVTRDCGLRYPQRICLDEEKGRFFVTYSEFEEFNPRNGLLLAVDLTDWPFKL